ncbi:ribosomal protein L7/L12 [Paenibacillus sp. WQ 127069]|jgi:large subunit ribosomal protein L7/L12|uniref:Ribosomal protein L7/L12 n=1 Tax=Paenibacillus baimaensis TaxID=2982185 RepID=A0ABT2UCK5_9BACL|nr:ribosomal protein L7/L12 [Paenibacillus sp. WQ 127069]MCU6792325.1 ribosomal protein L7/L12 [Paenibacillus sp. WQ 127069]
METVEIIALSALALSLLLLLKVFSLQRQLNEIKSDLQGPNIGPKVYGSSKPNLNTPPSSNLDERLRLLLASGKRIQAIKEFKKASGLGLKEAKDYVDSLERGQY